MICYFHNDNLPVFLLTAYAKNQKANLTKAERNELKQTNATAGTNVWAKEATMKKAAPKQRLGENTVGAEIIESVKEAIAWVAVRTSRPASPRFRCLLLMFGRCAGSLLSQSQFAAKFGFQPATLRNWEQGRTRDGPARVLLAVIARHPDAVEDTLRLASWFSYR